MGSKFSNIREPRLLRHNHNNSRNQTNNNMEEHAVNLRERTYAIDNSAELRNTQSSAELRNTQSSAELRNTQSRAELRNTQRRPRRQEVIIDDDITYEYNQIISHHQYLDTLKKSEKQQTFYLKDYHQIKLETTDIFLQEECPICLEKLKKNNTIYLIPCCHYFHKECLKNWVMVENYCPICRSELGKHSQDEIDMAILTRDIKVNNSKLQYLNKMELPELLEIIEKNNINIKSDKKENILKEIMDDLSKIVIFNSNQIQSEDSINESESIDESSLESSNYISPESSNYISSESNDSKLFELSSSEESESSLSTDGPINIRQIIRVNR